MIDLNLHTLFIFQQVGSGWLLLQCNVMCVRENKALCEAHIKKKVLQLYSHFQTIK